MLTAEFYFPRVTDIPPAFFADNGIEAVLLDIDNTLAADGARDTSPAIKAWVRSLAENGVRACVLSNNKNERIESFAALIGLPFVENARKPLTIGVRRALALLGARPKAAAVIGDQIFTDIACARFSGCRSVLVDFFAPETKGYFKVKRWLERPFLRGAKRKAKRK